MNGIAARLALLATAVAAVALAGCSTSGSAAGAAPAGTAAATSGGVSDGAVNSGTKKPTPAATRSIVADPRKLLPAVTAATVSGVTYGSASATDRARFAPVMKASGGLLVSSSVKTLKVAGADVGGVGIYAVKPGLSKSATFQDQYVVQLVNAVAGTKSAPKFVRADGQVLALSAGTTGVAGWFEGSQVVLIYRAGQTPDLTGLALGVRKSSGAR